MFWRLWRDTREVKKLKHLPPDQALDLLEEEARAGASDQWLAAQADVSLRQVSQWRKKKGLSSDQGPVMETLTALRGLAQNYEPKTHATTIAWTEPSYVLREPLDYTQFARACFTLEVLVGFSRAHVAHALGVRVHDIERAIALWRRHLQEHGKKCLGCDALIDDRFGGFCSRRCHDAAVSR